MYHIFFIHSSVDGHLGCFHVLAILFKRTFYLFIYLFIYFWLLWVFVAVQQGRIKRGLLFVAVRGLLIAVASLVEEHGL